MTTYQQGAQPEESDASTRSRESLGDRIDALETVPSADEYVEGFRQIELTDDQKALLIAQYRAPDRTATAPELAESLQMSFSTVNLFYGKLAHKLSDAMGVVPIERPFLLPTDVLRLCLQRND